jgi:hypothetical protein
MRTLPCPAMRTTAARRIHGPSTTFALAQVGHDTDFLAALHLTSTGAQARSVNNLYTAVLLRFNLLIKPLDLLSKACGSDFTEHPTTAALFSPSLPMYQSARALHLQSDFHLNSLGCQRIMPVKPSIQPAMNTVYPTAQSTTPVWVT